METARCGAVEILQFLKIFLWERLRLSLDKWPCQQNTGILRYAQNDDKRGTRRKKTALRGRL
jgi:hypothetical protein